MLHEQIPITILSLSPSADDHAALAEILQAYGWAIHSATTLLTATHLLQVHPISVVVCERDLCPHWWKDLLGELAAIPKPPFLVVTSCHADDYLWAEALNLGAYDVLLKPFDGEEVRCALGMAALHWQWNREPTLPLLVRVASASRARSSELN